jgi:hypothetical protein
MPSESKVRSAGCFRAVALLLTVGAFTLLHLGAADLPTMTGTWKADISKTSPPDNSELAVTLTIAEAGFLTYAIRFDRQIADRGVVSEEMTVTCDGKTRPLSEADSGAGGGKVVCPRLYPTVISIRVTQNDGTLIEQVFRLSANDGTLNYTKTTAGHDRTYVFSRQ